MTKRNMTNINLRFKPSEIKIIRAVLAKLVGHEDVAKGCRDIIVNVVNQAIQEIKKQTEQRQDEQGNDGDSRGDIQKVQQGSGDADSNVLADEKDTKDKG